MTGWAVKELSVMRSRWIRLSSKVLADEHCYLFTH
jgi:hypothetical protein